MTEVIFTGLGVFLSLFASILLLLEQRGRFLGAFFGLAAIILAIALIPGQIHYQVYVAKMEEYLPPVSEQLPHYSEVQSFLEADTTDKITYRKYADLFDLWQGFICGDFATTVVENARNNGLQAYVTVLFYYDSPGNLLGHAIVCFDTADAGRVFIEPQNDEPYTWPEKVQNMIVFERR